MIGILFGIVQKQQYDRFETSPIYQFLDFFCHWNFLCKMDNEKC
jgi:hypothetical protein